MSTLVEGVESGENIDNDFGFYGEDKDEAEVKDIHGITDTVTEYTYSNLKYPCLIFRKNFKCHKHKMKVISNMVKSRGIVKDISLYFEQSDGVYKIGEIGGIQVNSLLDCIGDENLIGFYDESTELTGSLLYTLCSF